jgi:hypothetical protein
MLLNRTNFNPWIRFALLAKRVINMKPPVTRENFLWWQIFFLCYSPIFAIHNNAVRNLRESIQARDMLRDKRIGHTRIKVIDCRRTGSEPRYGDWIGTAVIDGEEKTFTADCEFEPANEYWVVYERFEVLPGKDGIRVHSIIGE